MVFKIKNMELNFILKIGGDDMKILKPFVFALGFVPAIFYFSITLMLLFNSIAFLTLIPAIIISMCLILAPIYLVKDNQAKWIGFIAVGIIVISLFIEAVSPYAFSSSFSAGMGIAALLFFAFYYFIQKMFQKVISAR